jgi:hypothetical protein
MIKETNKQYYRLPIGGELTKKMIYGKIKDLFKKIIKDEKMKKEEEIKKDKTKKDIIEKEPLVIDYKNIAIHIDLAESKKMSLINEFLFSFLITKFYTYNEDIIYIPNNLNIYIEISYCFQNYFTKIGILNEFYI